MNYQEFRHYSITHGCRVARLSTFDANGDELYVVVPINQSSLENRKNRDRALECLAAAVESESITGCVSWQ